MKKLRHGFTFPELAAIIFVLGLLAAIAVPKFYDLMGRSFEGSTKGSLSSVRSAIQVYYGDNGGKFPTDTLKCLLLNARYLAQMPLAKTKNTGHDVSSHVAVALLDGPGWLYFNDPASVATWGNFGVNCTHEDEKGQSSDSIFMPWSTF
jgi:Tfp pilus assembly protein PilE